jgi:integrase
MTGSLKKRSQGSWSIVLYLGRDPVTGKKRQKWHTFVGNKKKAHAELTRLLYELNTGAYVEPTKLTLKDYLERWLSDYAKTNVSGKTYERYEEIIRKHLVPALGGTPLSNLRPLHIQGYYAHALQTGKKRGEAVTGLSAQTVLHHHRILREALGRAVKWQLLVRNPADAVEPPKPPRREMRAINEAQTAWLLEVARGTRLYVPVLLAVTSGMRRGEFLALRWPDVDFITGSPRYAAQSNKLTPESASNRQKGKKAGQSHFSQSQSRRSRNTGRLRSERKTPSEQTTRIRISFVRVRMARYGSPTHSRQISRDSQKRLA